MKIIDKIKQMGSEKTQLKKQIEEVQAKIREVEQAKEILRAICQKQQIIREGLQKQGINFAAFLDRFHFEDVEDWKQSAKATLTATLPDYVNIVKNMRSYQEGIFALNRQESQTLKKNEEFLSNTIIPLAERIENRREEVSFEDTNLFALKRS